MRAQINFGQEGKRFGSLMCPHLMTINSSIFFMEGDVGCRHAERLHMNFAIDLDIRMIPSLPACRES
jgi:hypothetical protein